MILTTEVPAGLDHRWALLLLVGLLSAAVAGVVTGWLRLLPPEREPFAAAGQRPAKAERDYFAVFFLANISFSLLLRIPPIESDQVFARFTAMLPRDWSDNAGLIVTVWFGFIPGLAAAYSAVRPNPLRLPLFCGGLATLLLWFAAPWLRAAIASQ
jgi:hypothetical protein